MTDDLQAYVALQVERLNGPMGEQAFHSLIEAPREVLPILQKAYTIQANLSLRAAIVEVVWQFRDASTLPFLAETLGAVEDEVWRQALDGIVTLGGAEAVAILTDACKSGNTYIEKQSYLEEAIEQIGTNNA